MASLPPGIRIVPFRRTIPAIRTPGFSFSSRRGVFASVKIGTGAPAGGGAEMIDWVIGVPSQAERKILVDSFERAVKAAADILENGCQKAMNDYN